MARAIAYTGAPVLLQDLLFEPPSPFRSASGDGTAAQYAGFGIAAWTPSWRRPELPLIYRSMDLPLLDANLRGLGSKLSVTAAIAHVREVPAGRGQVTTGSQNLHPFHYPGYRLALAHLGELAGFREMRFALLDYVRPEIAAHITGDSDSEWIYALLLSQLVEPREEHECEEIVSAVKETLRILREVRDRLQLRIASPVNLLLCDGRRAVAIRFALDFGCYDAEHPELFTDEDFSYPTLWYRCVPGRSMDGGVDGASDAGSVLMSTEPLHGDGAVWFEVPEYSAVYVSRDGKPGRLTVKPLVV